MKTSQRSGRFAFLLLVAALLAGVIEFGARAEKADKGAGKKVSPQPAMRRRRRIPWPFRTDRRKSSSTSSRT